MAALSEALTCHDVTVSRRLDLLHLVVVAELVKLGEKPREVGIR